MFLDGAFEQEGQQKLLDCTPLQDEIEIKNKSCTLTPQVTQGEYQFGAPKTIAETDD